jgi:hypothetical protein
MTLRLDWVGHEAAAHACKHWHYSRIPPAGRLMIVGVWESDAFKGVVIFSRGANNNIGRPYGLGQTEVCELTRVALRQHDAPVSRIVAIAMKLLRRKAPGLRLIVSYADPVQSHHGGIYQAGGWTYTGPTRAQRELLVNGKALHKRTANSRWGTGSPERIRAITGLQVEYGPSEWKHTYLMPLDAAMRAAIKPLAKSYPKRVKQATAENHSDGGGAAPTHALQQLQAINGQEGEGQG